MNVIFPFNCSGSITANNQPGKAPNPSRRVSTRVFGGRMGVLLLWALIVTMALVGCTGRQLGGAVEGWSPVVLGPTSNPDDPVLIYVVAKLSGDLKDLATSRGLDKDAFKDDENRVKVKALVDDGSGSVEVKWSFPPLGSGEGIEGSFGPPVDSDTLGLIFVSSISGELFAIDTETGTVGENGWNRQVSADGASLVAGPALGQTIDGDGRFVEVVVVGSENGNLYAFDAVKGEPLRWSPFTGAGDKLWSTPVIKDGTIYFGSHDASVYAVSLKTGEQIWKFETGGAVVAKPLIFGNMLIVGSFDKKLYALNIRTGTPLWEQPFEGRNWFWASAIADDTTIFAPSMDGNIYALDKAGGLKWSFDMGGQIVATPGLVPAGLAVAAKGGKVALLDTVQLGRGTEGQYSPFTTDIKDAEIKVQLFPIAQDNSVIISAQDGRVWRYRISTGLNQVWCFDASDDSKCE